MPKRNVPVVVDESLRPKLWRKALQLANVGNAFAMAAHYMKAAAMFNIHEHELYREIGAENWEQFCTKMPGLTKGVANYFLTSGKRMDAILRASDVTYDGIIEEHHVKMIREADLSVKEFREKEIRLLGDGTVVVRDKDFKQLPNAQEYQAIDDDLQKALALVIKRRKDAKRGRRKDEDEEEATKERLAADVRTGVTALAKAAFALRQGFAGFRETERREMQYHLRLLEWYTTHPWVEDDTEWTFVSYEDTGKLVPGERPDVDYALEVLE